MLIFLDKIPKLFVDASKQITFMFLCVNAAYIEYKPIFAPISQKVTFFFEKLLIHYNVSSSLEKYVAIFH
jgi:hypothetical protein